MAGGHVWLGGMHGGGMHDRVACIVGGVCGTHAFTPPVDTKR